MARDRPCAGRDRPLGWLPEFDLYERYNETLYEAASDIDWFRSGLQRHAHEPGLSARRLRFSRPGSGSARELAGAIDASKLNSLLRSSKSASTLRIVLRANASLGDQEAALQPILPKAVPPTP